MRLWKKKTPEQIAKETLEEQNYCPIHLIKNEVVMKPRYVPGYSVCPKCVQADVEARKQKVAEAIKVIEKAREHGYK